MDEAYYYALRAIARKRALDEINSRILRDGGASVWHGTTLASITDDAIEFATHVWPRYYSGQTHLGFVRPWENIWAQSRLQPSRFEIAVWQEVSGSKVLQALATGTRSSGNAHLTLNWVERYFGPEYTRYGALIPILSSFEHYAWLLNVDRVLIRNPVDPSKYERFGYVPHSIKGSRTEFLSKEIRND